MRKITALLLSASSQVQLLAVCGERALNIAFTGTSGLRPYDTARHTAVHNGMTKDGLRHAGNASPLCPASEYSAPPASSDRLPGVTINGGAEQAEKTGSYPVPVRVR